MIKSDSYWWLNILFDNPKQTNLSYASSYGLLMWNPAYDLDNNDHVINNMLLHLFYGI